MNHDDARALIAEILHRIAPDVDVDAVPDDAVLQDEVDLDSMDFLHVVTAVHDRTGIDIPERDYPRLATIGGFVEYLTGARTPG